MRRWRKQEIPQDSFGNFDPSDALLDHLEDLPAEVGTSRRTTLEASVCDLRAQREASVYMEERVRLGVEIERVSRDLYSAIGRGEQ